LTTTTEIDHAEKHKRGRYWIITKAGEAELTYSLGVNDSMIINSTFVPMDARGGGVALALVKRAVEDAKAVGRKVDPVCPYVDRVFARHPEWMDLRA
jgi:predicted GNAT family acetyltransferase